MIGFVILYKTLEISIVLHNENKQLDTNFVAITCMYCAIALLVLILCMESMLFNCEYTYYAFNYDPKFFGVSLFDTECSMIIMNCVDSSITAIESTSNEKLYLIRLQFIFDSIVVIPDMLELTYVCFGRHT